MVGRTVAFTVAAALAAALLAGCLAGCTAQSGPAALGATTSPRSARTVTHTVTTTTTRHASAGPSPIHAGRTRSAAGTCRLIARQTVANDVGMRLARTTVQRSGDEQVGCRFYALQDSPLAVSERLPGPDQPAVQITLLRYASATAAHNAMVRRADAGTNPQQVTIRDGELGLAFQSDFYAADDGRDWFCAFTSGSTLAVVATVTTRTAFNAVTVARHLAAGLG